MDWRNNNKKKYITALGKRSLQIACCLAECTDFTKSFLTRKIPYGFTFDLRPKHKYSLPCIDVQETRIRFAILCADIMTQNFTENQKINS